MYLIFGLLIGIVSFCQNYQISQDGLGRAVDSAEFADICLKLQAAGAENINLVTGSHHIPKIAEFCGLHGIKVLPYLFAGTLRRMNR